MARQLISTLALLLISMSAFSANYKIYKEGDKSRAKLLNKKPLNFYYQKTSWNIDPTKVESGYLFLRDMKTGVVQELYLTETKPNSSVFQLEIPIGGLKAGEIHAEIYSVPPSLLTGKSRMETVMVLLNKKALKRKPFLLRVLRRKGQLLDVFDDKKAALASYETYKKQLGLSENIESESIIEIKQAEKPVEKKIIDTSTLQSLFMANDAEIKSQNLKDSELRDVLMKIEKKRREAVKINSRSWGRSLREKNKQEAGKLTQKAVYHSKEKHHSKAMDQFYKASDLVPNYEDLYQQYGVGLFNNKKFNQSIIVLLLAKSSKKRQVEKEFYLAMNYYQLKDYENAIKHFDTVMKMNHPDFSPTAAFYKGSALNELKRYDEAKVAFQYVLDNSKNPEMDKRAEKFIEYSIDRKSFEKRRSNRFFYSGVLGFMHDENITLALDSTRDSGAATNLHGWRFMAQGNLKYRPYYRDTDEIAITIDALGIQSVNDNFSSNPVLEQADPYVFGLKIPWTHRGTFKNKGYFFDLEPGFETILMDYNGSEKKQILNSYLLNFRNSLVVSKTWIAKANFIIRVDDSGILNDAPDAFRVGANFSSIFVLDQDLERYLIPELGYTINSAKGNDYSYSRLDMAVTLTSSLFDTLVWSNRLGLYFANYKSNRSDTNYSFSTGLSYRLNPNWNIGANAAYTVNDSTTNHYNKIVIMTTAAFTY